jgi:hypothetical protein
MPGKTVPVCPLLRWSFWNGILAHSITKIPLHICIHILYIYIQLSMSDVCHFHLNSLCMLSVIFACTCIRGALREARIPLNIKTEMASLHSGFQKMCPPVQITNIDVMLCEREKHDRNLMVGNASNAKM